MGELRRVKVALVSPPPHSPLAFVDYQNPLIGIAYLASVLEKNGCQVIVLDCPALHRTYDYVEQEVRRFKPDIVGITSVTATFSSALKVAQTAKEAHPQTFVVLGGPHVTIADDQFLLQHPEVDVVVKGEGEQTIVELARYVSTKGGIESLNGVAGISFRNNGQVARTADRSCIPNLDELPYPAYHYFPLNKYQIYGKLGLSMLTSRGCSGQCSFCLVPQIAGDHYRARTPKNVADEFEWLTNKYKPGFISFNDEVFTYDKKRTLEICSEIKKRGLKTPWDCQTRVDRISRELLYNMAAANCQLITYGVESGSQEILNAMKKGTTVEQNETAMKWAKEAGLSVNISLVIGYPGETKETLKQTIDFVKKNEPDDVYLYLATPYPTTGLRDLVGELGWKMSQDWTCYEMQSPVFENMGLAFGKINNKREVFYNQLYSPAYILRQAVKGTIYNKIMVQNALHQLLWRIKIPWLSADYKKLIRM
jgi:anaerobic magnesium-protoporphyrin IX monomethyl ester cyclase